MKKGLFCIFHFNPSCYLYIVKFNYLRKLLIFYVSLIQCLLLLWGASFKGS